MKKQIQTFVYEKIEGGVRILRCFSSDKKAVIPEEIDGLPVKEIGAYAFSDHMDRKILEKKQQEAAVQIKEGIFGREEELCGERLEAIELPDSVRKVGAYCFYNCSQLHRISFGSSVEDWGTGAFTGCHQVKVIRYRQLPDTRPCLKEVLSELPEQLCVEYREGAAYAKLMFPEYYEEGVENTPARILMTHFHGSGLYYRNCFEQRYLNFFEYDSRFPVAMPLEDEEFLAALVLGRLQHPFQLAEKSKKRYEDYVGEHLESIGECLLKKKDRDGLFWLAEHWLKGECALAQERRESCINAWIETAGTMRDGEALAYLMDFRHRYCTRAVKRPVFEL